MFLCLRNSNWLLIGFQALIKISETLSASSLQIVKISDTYFSILKSLAEGTHISCQDIKNAEFPVIITNTELFKRNDAKIFTEVLKYTTVLDTAWNGVNVLNHNIGSAGIQSLSKFLPLSSEDFVNLTVK